MNGKTLKALKQSIAHWQRLASNQPHPYESVGVRSCALCRRFIDQACKGCPVRKKTGWRYCQETPYRYASHVFHLHGLGSASFTQAAKKEVKFLQSLLPKTKKKGTK